MFSPATFEERNDALQSLSFSSAHPRDYWELLKPRVMALVVFTGGIGMLLAPHAGDCHPFLWFVALLCLAVGAGAAAVFNMVGDQDIDGLMARTCLRPLPGGRIEREKALTFGVFLAIGSVLTLGLAVNLLASLLLAFTIFFYSVVYTLGFKRRTPQNIVIGGAAGALPPVIGWVSVSGGWADPLPWILFVLIFLWTPPHFWALALNRTSDYARANVPMLPVVVGAQKTIRQIVLYTILLISFSLLPWRLGLLGDVYGFSALGLGGYFGLSVWRLGRKRGGNRGALVFRDSIVYLFLLFLSMAVDWGVR